MTSILVWAVIIVVGGFSLFVLGAVVLVSMGGILQTQEQQEVKDAEQSVYATEPDYVWGTDKEASRARVQAQV